MTPPSVAVEDASMTNVLHQVAPLIEGEIIHEKHPEDLLTRHQPLDSRFINEAELLRRLPVSRRTLHNWRRAGKIPSILIGRRVLYCWENVADALRRLERGGAK